MTACKAYYASADPDCDDVALCDLPLEQHTSPDVHRAGDLWFSRYPQPWDDETT